jgi:hypothetical protein
VLKQISFFFVSKIPSYQQRSLLAMKRLQRVEIVRNKGAVIHFAYANLMNILLISVLSVNFLQLSREFDFFFCVLRNFPIMKFIFIVLCSYYLSSSFLDILIPEAIKDI